MAKAPKNLEIAVLLDHYGPALTEKQRMILTQYYDDDLSLAEIAENFGITRQGVRDAIKHGEAALLELEERLGVARRYTGMLTEMSALRRLLSEIRVENSGAYTPSARIEAAVAAAQAALARMETLQQEDADGI